MKSIKDGIFFYIVGGKYQPVAKMLSVFSIMILVFLYTRLVDLFDKQNLSSSSSFFSESLIVLIAAVPLIIYIFTKDSDIKKYLQYLLYLFIAAITFYWIFGSYGIIWSIFHGYFSFSGFSCFFTGCYGESGSDLFLQSGIFLGDFKALFYLGIIFLTIKNKNRIEA
jgi:hypothetical protein